MSDDDSTETDAPNVVMDRLGHPKIAAADYQSPYDQDWRVLFGLTLTCVYLILMSLYIGNEVGWLDFTHLSVERMGSFLEGAFAPLAFLWLVIGYFLQKKELRLNTDAMKMQFIEIQKSAEQAVEQTQAIARSELHQRRESFLKMAELVRSQLGTIVGMIYLSSQMSESNEETVSTEKLSHLWMTMGRDDPEVFSREMLRLLTISSETYRYKLLFGTEIRTRHTENFEHTFARLINAARRCDEDQMVEDALLGGSHGSMYQRIKTVRENIPAGFRMGEYDFDPDSRVSDKPTA
ncbi:hypothetical protein EYC98_10295 [Halieaceae bacterium IMCC14734]|uniref:Uncharacterized protein n=1 Tax=Candidatus Litorirhabdus singularis TaxID=2518993 RepID=A0ABT3TG24_9GAMM|nr:hypothetical protein [Candidatus Litorirhabdus singularis]MCX2981252.1 hypothetical protein [Candidatus Litorirhabdus singularis]